MNYGSDPADQIVRISLEGTEMVLKLSGLAAKNFALFVYALDIRFKLEEERAAQGLPLTGRAFFTALDDRLEQEGCPRRRNKE